MKSVPTDWADQVAQEMQDFARQYGSRYSKTKRELYAFFEIGCFLSLVKLYKGRGCEVELRNLLKGGEYRYLTTPNGNPANFSYVYLSKDDHAFELRQQVRIVSHIDPDIAFTPDIIVIKAGTEVLGKLDKDYAGGKRKFFHVKSSEVVAAHECKSYSPFPELLVSFLGALWAGHAWSAGDNWFKFVSEEALHPAPTLFVGGEARPIQLRMISAMERALPLNIVVGMHAGVIPLEKKITVNIDPTLEQGGQHALGSPIEI